MTQQASPDAVDEWRVVRDETEVCASRTRAGRWVVTARSLRGRTLPRTFCETTFSLDLIQMLVETTGPEWICDTIARHENTEYVRRAVCQQLAAYFPLDEFHGKRLLDFGCGNGASTMAIASMLARTEVVGVELDDTNLYEANAILAHRGLNNVRFLRSPSPDSLPAGIGLFDFVMLSAVFEHVLPHERLTIMPLIWAHVRPGGAIFINQTPHRWHPFEHHSTGLWAINYLPDRVAHWVAKRFGRTKSQRRSWDEMLRGGIRGGTERSMITALTNGSYGDAEIMQPTELGLRDRADYWLSCTSPRWRPAKRAIASAFRLFDRTLHTIPALNVDVVIRKVR